MVEMNHLFMLGLFYRFSFYLMTQVNKWNRGGTILTEPLAHDPAMLALGITIHPGAGNRTEQESFSKAMRSPNSLTSERFCIRIVLCFGMSNFLNTFNSSSESSSLILAFSWYYHKLSLPLGQINEKIFFSKLNCKGVCRKLTAKEAGGFYDRAESLWTINYRGNIFNRHA